MNIEDYRDYCLSKKGVKEELPFDDTTLVYKVKGKVFSLADINLFESITIKCDPMVASQLRVTYAGVTPGYHMNKQHWNTVTTNGSIPDRMLYQWIDDSYELVVAGLSKKDHASLHAE
jgi:predicted DNA-binding protein (MmcQ/YjbR family)